MADPNNLSIFGLTPQEVAQQEQQQAKLQNFQLGQLDPLQMQRILSLNAGSGLNQAVGDFAKENNLWQVPSSPQMQEAETMQAVVKQVQKEGVNPTSDPIQFYQTVADRLVNAGLTRQGMDLSLKAQNLVWDQAKKKAEIGKMNAEAIKALRDKESAIQTLNREYANAKQSGNEEDAKRILDQITKLNQPETTLVTEGDPNNPELRRQAIVDRNGNKTYVGTPYKQAPNTIVDLTQTADKAIIQAETDVWKDTYKTFQEDRATMAKGMDSVGQLRAILDTKNLDTGFGANLKAKVRSALAEIGVGDVDTLTNDQLFSKYASQFVLPQLKNLKGSLSDKDREWITNANPNAEMTPKAIRHLLDIYEKTYAKSQKIFNDFQTGKEQGKQSTNYDFITGRWYNGAPPKSPYTYDTTGQPKYVGTKPVGTKSVSTQQELNSKTGDVPASTIQNYRAQYPDETSNLTDAQIADLYRKWQARQQK